MTGLVITGLWPAFWDGQAPTLVRQVVLGTAASLFGLAALYWAVAHLRSPGLFIWWYANGLALYSLGLIGLACQPHRHSMVTWVGLAPEDLASVCFLVAALSATRFRAPGRPGATALAASVLWPVLPYRILVEVSSEAVIALDSRLGVLYWNGAASRLFGYPAAGAFGPGLPDLIVPAADRAEVAAAMRRRLQPPARDGQPLALDLARRDGGAFPAACSFYRAGWPHNLLVCVVQDLSRLRRAQDRVRRLSAGLEQRVREAPRCCARTTPGSPTPTGNWSRSATRCPMTCRPRCGR